MQPISWKGFREPQTWCMVLVCFPGGGKDPPLWGQGPQAHVVHVPQVPIVRRPSGLWMLYKCLLHCPEQRWDHMGKWKLKNAAAALLRVIAGKAGGHLLTFPSHSLSLTPLSPSLNLDPYNDTHLPCSPISRCHHFRPHYYQQCPCWLSCQGWSVCCLADFLKHSFYSICHIARPEHWPGPLWPSLTPESSACFSELPSSGPSPSDLGRSLWLPAHATLQPGGSALSLSGPGLLPPLLLLFLCLGCPLFFPLN